MRAASFFQKFILSALLAFGSIVVPSKIYAQCGSTPTVNIKPPACPGEKAVVFSINPISGATSYSWIVTNSSQATITSATNGTSVSVDFSSSFTGCNLVVYGIFSCGAGTALTIPVNATGGNPLPGTPGAISGTQAPASGQTNVSYSVAAVSNATNYIWSLPAGASLASGTNTNSITVNFTSCFAGGQMTVRANNMSCMGDFSPALSIHNTLPATPGAVNGSVSVVPGQTGVSYSVPSVPNTTSYQWSLPANATIATGSGTNNITVNFSSSFVSGDIKVAAVSSCGTSAYSPPLTISRLPAPAGTISQTSGTTCDNGVAWMPLGFSIPPIANATSYQWIATGGPVTFSSPSSGANLTMVSIALQPNYPTSSVTLEVWGINSYGSGTHATFPITIYKPASAAGAISGPQLINPGQSGVVYAVPVIQNANPYVWALPAGVTSTGTDNTRTLTFPSNFTGGDIRVFGVNGPCGAGAMSTLTVSARTSLERDQLNQNMIITRNILKSGVTSDSQIPALTSDDVQMSISYLDGAGKSVQNISWQGSPTKMDVVSEALYDDLGRETYQFPPITSLTQSNGYREPSILVQTPGSAFDETTTYGGSLHYNFYNNSTSDATYKTPDDAKPFTKTIYDYSPLSRVTQQGGIGSIWQPVDPPSATAKTPKIMPGTNAANEVRRWSVDGQYAGSGISCDYYPLGTLSVTTITNDADPQHLQTKRYTNSKGQLVLARQQLDATNWSSTYYVYDKYDQLRVIIPPMAANVIETQSITSVGQTPSGYQVLSQNTTLTSSTGLFMYMPGVTVSLSPTQTWSPTFDLKPYTGSTNYYLLDLYATQYAYDELGRKIAEKSPGADWVYYVYDSGDRLVLTQDGNQRIQSQWTFTKYDILSRPILSGLTTLTGTLADIRAAVQASTSLCEGRGSAVHGYTNNAYPNVPDENAYLTVTYYDDYTFKTLLQGSTNYNYKNDELSGLPTTELLQTKGLVTGTRTKILNSSPGQWLWTLTYYDNHARSVQVVGDNHNSGVDRITTKYNFPGWVISTRTSHSGGTVNNIVIEDYEYDQSGRSLRKYHQLGTDPLQRKQVTALVYNELGHVIQKRMHVDATGNGLQHVDFRRNIRGAVRGINISAPDSGDPTDYFTETLAYEEQLTGNNVRYDGLITASRWQNDISAKGRGYNYDYDNQSQLKNSNYIADDGTGAWANQTDFYTEKNIGYDLNGNISNLMRYTKQLNAVSLIDNLTYNYGSGSTRGNQLNYVTDASSTQGFSDGNTGNDDYGYDANGNLIRDKNRGIVSITYNYLNLPERVTNSDNSYTQYTYDALGSKLRQTFYNSSNQAVVKTDYIGEQVYVNDVLVMLTHSDGRILPPSYVNLITNSDAGSLDGFTAQGSVSLTSQYLNSQTYVQGVCNQSSGTPGILPIGKTFSVKAGENYTFKVLGYQSSGTSAQLYVTTNLGTLSIPVVALPQGAGNETWSTVTFYIPATATQLNVGVVWSAPASGNSINVNQVALYKTDWEYQYFITDHLGSPRAVLSTNPSTLDYTATFETKNQSLETQRFINIDYSKVTVHPSNITTGGSQVIAMDNSYHIGPARSLNVYPGDKIDASVHAYYDAATGLTHTSGSVMASALISLMSGGSQPIIDGINNAYTNPGNSSALALSPDKGATLPSSFINYILFDENYIPLEAKSVPLSATPGVSQTLAQTINVSEAGILFVYLSYDNESTIPVYFDDFKITHTESPLVQVNNYYPYGMTSYSWLREGEFENRFLFQGKEFDAHTGWHDFHARQYDASLGRWFVADPAGQYVSPYLALGNNPANGIDPDGKWFGIDDVIVAAAGLAYGYVSYGIGHHDWGGKALANGGINAALFELGYLTGGGGLVGAGASTESSVAVGAAEKYLASSAISMAASQVTPSVPLYQNGGFLLNISPTFSLQGMGASLNGSYTNGDWSVGGGVGFTVVHGAGVESRFGGGVNYFDGHYGGSYSLYNYGGSERQRIGEIGVRFGHNGDVGFRVSNDLFLGADGGDRYRTAAGQLSYKNYSLGILLHTGDPDANGKRSNYVDHSVGGKGGQYYGGTANDASLRAGIAYFGYNGYRFGWNSDDIRHMFQNKIIHDNFLDWFGEPSPWFSRMSIGSHPYFNFGANNPFSLWGY